MITLDGTLGITTPAETVQGALTTTGNTILGDATTDTLTVGVTGIVKDASGNVGIGTATPRSVAGYTTLGLNNTTGGIVDFFSSGTRVLSVIGTSTSCNINTITNIPLTLGVNTNDALTIDTSSNLKFNSGYGSVATAYGCRAWVNFNGTGTVAIRASGNVSSITDNGTGDYTVNFTTAMPDANYNVCGSVNGVGGNPLDEMVFAPKTGGTFSTSAVQIFTINPGSAGAGDSTYVSCSIFR
jgi:hypothetical protein